MFDQPLSAAGRKTANVGIAYTGKTDQLAVLYEYVAADGKRTPVVQMLNVHWTLCRFGGRRPWLACPFCQRRSAKLMSLKAGKLRRRLGISADDIIGPGSRPPRMRMRTFTRLTSAIEGLEHEARSASLHAFF